MAKYVVKPGRTLGRNKEHKAGSIVELTEAEAEGLKAWVDPCIEPEPVAAATGGKGGKGSKEGDGNPKE